MPETKNYFILHSQAKNVFKPPKTQLSMQKLEQKKLVDQDRNLKVNEKKTQLLSISSGKCNTKCWITLKDGSTKYSNDSFKLLGFMFSNKPNVNEQINHIVNRATSRGLLCFDTCQVLMRIKPSWKTFTVQSLDLLWSTAVCLLALWKLNLIETDLRMSRKKCLRSIYGYGLNYEELLEMSGLETFEKKKRPAI